MTADTYSYTRLRVPGPGWKPRWEHSRQQVVDRLSSSGSHLWGVFAGRFGIASDELVVIAHGPEGAPGIDQFPIECHVVEHHEMRATARPEDPTPLRQPGLHVLRWFHLDPANVDEFLDLSTSAWTDFETDDDFATRPVGLFAVPGVAAQVDRMLLVTWYDGFESWSRSRTPAPAARERFMRRHQLTHNTLALATELVVP